MHKRKRGLLPALAAALLSIGLPSTAFSAETELPVAVDDSFTSTEHGIVVSGNVLENDNWNSGVTATLTDAELWAVKPPGNGSYVDITFEPNGMIYVDFSPAKSEDVGKPRSAEVGYTLTDSAKNFSTGRAVFTEKPEAVEPELVEPTAVEPEAESVADSGSSDEKGDSTSWNTSASATSSGSSTLVSIMVAVLFGGFLAYEFARKK